MLRSAAEGLYQLYWSEEILNEARHSLVSTGTITNEQADRLLAAMKGAFPEAMVTGYEALVSTMPNDEDDRHVAAAAVKASAQIIVTSNLKDFRCLPEGLDAQSPDQFLSGLFQREPDTVVEILRVQAAALRRPPRSFDELLAGLAKVVPNFAKAARQHLE